ncbi:unnamed protein product [Linum trigynum]|uniref:Gnk2-homologous domain-containing protein n=1 Tax=Linum trigynum TaxID=586398 RepID=A0AAV2FKE1_9ROSI
MAVHIFPAAAALVVGLLLAGDLGAGGVQYCSLIPATIDPFFPTYVDSLLDELVVNTPNKDADASSGDTRFASMFPLMDGNGGARGEATCYSGVTGDSCKQCLTEARPYVSQCRNYTTGGAKYDGRCIIQFWELSP